MLINYLPFDGTPGNPSQGYMEDLTGNDPTTYAVQNNSTNAYLFADSNPLSYGSLITTPTYISGGGEFLRSNATFSANNTSTWGLNGLVSSTFDRQDIDRGSYWNSFLYRDDNNNGNALVYALGNGGSNFIGFSDLSDNTFLFGVQASNNGPYTVTYKSGDFDDMGTMDPMDDDDAKVSQVLGVNSTVGQTDFLVTNIEFGDGTGNIIYSLWINPTLGPGGPGVADFTVSVPWSNFASNSSIQAGIDSAFFNPGSGLGDGSIDEFRQGTTFAAVAPIPEPSVASLFSLIVASSVIRRRKQR